MVETAAVRIALDLLHLPASVRRARDEPLPADVFVLLRIVAGDQEVEREAARLEGRRADRERDDARHLLTRWMLP